MPAGARVLTIRLRSLGDLVLTLPALSAVHAWRPDLRLVLAVEPAYEELFRSHPAVAAVLPVQSFLSAVRQIRAGGFAVAYNLHGGPTSGLLLAASGAPVRVSWMRSRFARAANVRVPGPEAFFGARAVHTAEHRLTPFYWTGLPPGSVPPASVPVEPAAVESVRRRLQVCGIGDGVPYALLRPGARRQPQRWPLERFARLAEQFAARGLIPVVNFGPGEEVLRAEFVERWPRAAVVLAGLRLSELAALAARARLFVGNDSGPTHLAAAVGCPVVALFGPTCAAWWRPWTASYRLVQPECACGPVPPERCRRQPDRPCLHSVSVEQVAQACQELLAETEPTGQGAKLSD